MSSSLKDFLPKEYQKAKGIEKKIFPELLQVTGIQKIIRHRLNYQGMDIQQERTWSKGGFKASKDKGKYKTNLAIIDRGVLLEPNLYLAFKSKIDAHKAMTEHICMCRNEDVMLPNELIELSENEFDAIDGFELLFDGDESSLFKVGHNRFNNANEMYGQLRVFGNPIRQPQI